MARRFSTRTSPMEFTSSGGGGSEEPDKIDMSLDDIIRLNKKAKQRKASGSKPKLPLKGRFSQGRRSGPRAAGAAQRGPNSRFGPRARKAPPSGTVRRGQGVITGLAARKTASRFKGISPLHRPAINKPPQRTRQLVREPQRRRTEVQRRPFRQPDAGKNQSPQTRRPFQLRRWTAPPINQAQKDARQATFLYRRGLKVHAQFQKPAPPAVKQRTRLWRTSTTASGILTVCIDNPSARTQPEPPQAWSLHPPTSVPIPAKTENEPERKPPKGVPLQFDINSVGKQTAITLNERFRILKDKRTTAAKSSKAGRFVTVG
ncbi:UAP56-interacting factor-like [Denticeps clupeoides]|uniref:UAP56-interacting factor n=1 Tax=Denticeps clupeoides TaxID=299321 RepID=A0AAY4ACD5_9TELE|nr:UAP56-interacting factor [Denticeps clupeoides]